MTDTDKSASDSIISNPAAIADILAEVNQKSQDLVAQFMEKQKMSGVIDQAEAESVGKSFQQLAGRLMVTPCAFSTIRCPIGRIFGAWCKKAPCSASSSRAT